MPEISFFTCESIKSVDNSGNSIYAYNLSIANTTRDVNRFLASNFDNKAVTSFSEFFCPYTTQNNDAIMPYAKFPNRGQINQLDANGNPTGELIDSYPGSGDMRGGEIIAIDMSSGLNYGVVPTFDLSDGTQIYDKQDITNIRSLALRSPVMVAGFGYTTEGIPIPSVFDDKARNIEIDEDEDEEEADEEEDEDDEDDEATIQDDTYRFANNVRSRPDIWPAGPLDLRWDKYKNMYVAAPEMFLGYALCDIPASSGRYAPVRGDGVGYRSFNSGEIECAIGRFDDFHVPSGVDQEEGTVFSLHKLLIINRSVTMDISSGCLVIATRLNNGEYFPIFADCTPDIL